MQKSPYYRIKYVSVPFEDIIKMPVSPTNRPCALCEGGTESTVLFLQLKLQGLTKYLISSTYYKKALESTLNFVFNQFVMLL